MQNHSGIRLIIADIHKTPVCSRVRVGRARVTLGVEPTERCHLAEHCVPLSAGGHASIGRNRLPGRADRAHFACVAGGCAWLTACGRTVRTTQRRAASWPPATLRIRQCGRAQLAPEWLCSAAICATVIVVGRQCQTSNGKDRNCHQRIVESGIMGAGNQWFLFS